MSDSLTIRPFQTDDAEALIALWQQTLTTASPWNDPEYVIRRKRMQGDNLLFVGEQNERIVAAVMAGYDGVRGWIYALAVVDDCRRQAIGTRMMQHAEQELAARGCPKINLQVRATNRDVIAFYEQCGFAVEPIVNMGKPLVSDRREAFDPVPTLRVDDEITLSQVTWDDRAAFVEHLNVSDVYQRNNKMPYPYTQLDADQWVTHCLQQSVAVDRKRDWGVRDRGGKLIGGIGVFDLTHGEKCGMGYWMAQSHWGRGIITQAVRSLCTFVIAEYDLQCIYANAFGDNLASQRVLEKAGFEREGIQRRHIFRAGEPVDYHLFGLLRG